MNSSPTVDPRKAALEKRFRSAVRWTWLQRVIDIGIALGIVTGITLSYTGQWIAGILVVTLVFILASWRFYQWHRASEAASGGCDSCPHSSSDTPLDVGYHSVGESGGGDSMG